MLHHRNPRQPCVRKDQVRFSDRRPAGAQWIYFRATGLYQWFPGRYVAGSDKVWVLTKAHPDLGEFWPVTFEDGKLNFRFYWWRPMPLENLPARFRSSSPEVAKDAAPEPDGGA